MIKIECYVERVEDESSRHGFDDGEPDVGVLASVRFELTSCRAPSFGRSLGDVLATVGRRVTLLIDEHDDRATRHANEQVDRDMPPTAAEAAEADPREVPLVDWEEELRKSIKVFEADPSDPPPSGYRDRPPML